MVHLVLHWFTALIGDGRGLMPTSKRRPIGRMFPR
jgi:hypothetical protein